MNLWLWVGMVVLLVFAMHLDLKRGSTYLDYPPYSPRKGRRRPQD